MLIYNTSFHVDGEREVSKFLSYMRDVYLPAVTARGYLTNPRFVRLLTDVGDGILGYCLMCDCQDVKTLKQWKIEIGDTLMSSFHDHFGERILTFSSTMKDIELKG